MRNAQTSANSSAPLGRVQRMVAWLLLATVAALLVVNPLWECQDHMDTLRHLGPNGILVLFLLFACAAISLVKSLRLFAPTGSERLPHSVKMHAASRLQVRERLPAFSPNDLALSLRI